MYSQGQMCNPSSTLFLVSRIPVKFSNKKTEIFETPSLVFCGSAFCCCHYIDAYNTSLTVIALRLCMRTSNKINFFCGFIVLNSHYFGRIQICFKQIQMDCRARKLSLGGLKAPLRPLTFNSADTRKTLCFSADYVYTWDRVCTILIC